MPLYCFKRYKGHPGFHGCNYCWFGFVKEFIVECLCDMTSCLCICPPFNMNGRCLGPIIFSSTMVSKFCWFGSRKVLICFKNLFEAGLLDMLPLATGLACYSLYVFIFVFCFLFFLLISFLLCHC